MKIIIILIILCIIILALDNGDDPISVNEDDYNFD